MTPLWLWTATAWAHRPGLSYARIDAGELTVTFASPELAARGLPLDPPAADVLGPVLLDKAHLTVDGAPCTLGPPSARAVAGDGIEVAAPLTCPAGTHWTFSADYLADFPVGHRHYVEAFGEPVAVLDAPHPQAQFEAQHASGATAVAGQFLGLGVEHILTGYDHLAFLFGLLLVARGFKEMATIATGFTVAHSITLALAALQVVELSPAIVEPAIALSIAFVGVENFWNPPLKRRVAVTFALGLIHGFGFAGLLTELGLPRGQLALALVSFNAGVELGQLAIVLPLLPLLVWMRKSERWRDQGVKVCSAGVALAGVTWFVLRVAGL